MKQKKTKNKPILGYTIETSTKNKKMSHEIELDKGILEKLMSNNINDTEKNILRIKTDDEEELASSGLLLPIVQVINIQNIATSAVLVQSNKKNDIDETTTKKTNQKNQLTSDRYLLILSDGEYYETRCLLLPNLNYLVNSSKLRKGSVIRLERFELNLIPNGKILVIEQLTVLKNTINNNINVNTTDNERKSIMNNNLAETLKSIGIIGSLKPTSNNTQLKIRQQSDQKIESTDKNNNKNKYKKEDDDLDDDEDYEDVDEDELDDDEYDDDDYDEEDELDYEDDDDSDSEQDSKLKNVVDIILCKCISCKEQNTLKLCYRLLGLDETASLEKVKMKYSQLVKNELNGDDSVINSGFTDGLEQNDCNLDKLIRKLLKKKLFTITDSDRQEIRAKAYNLILSSFVIF